MRPGGEKRGNNRDRRRRKIWMLATFDKDLGPDKARCHLLLSDRCQTEAAVLDFHTVTADRINPGGTYAHPNIRPACRLCQVRQGGLITRERRETWRRYMQEAEAEGIAWDGVM